MIQLKVILMYNAKKSDIYIFSSFEAEFILRLSLNSFTILFKVYSTARYIRNSHNNKIPCFISQNFIGNETRASDKLYTENYH